MNRRLKKVERVLAVQQQMHRLAEWNLAALDREREELARSEEGLVQSLNQDDALHGLFVEAMARRLKALAREADRLNRARSVLSQRLTEEGLKLKRIERASDRTRRAWVAERDKRGFADLLDRLGRPDDASLP